MRKLRTWLTLVAVVLPLVNAVRQRRKRRRSRLQRLMNAANEQVTDARDTLGGATQERIGSVAQAVAGLAGAALAATPIATSRVGQGNSADAPVRQEDWRRYGEVFPR